MTKRLLLMPTQAEITRMLKAVRSAGFSQAHFIKYKDGRIALLAADVSPFKCDAELSVYEQWKLKNARKA
ncbi:transcription factor iiib subunit [Brucellaceae bacterium D45D]